MKKVLKICLWVLLSIILVLAIAIGVYFDRNLHLQDRLEKKVCRSGFFMKDAILSEGTVLHFLEGPSNGPALLLIHGQGMNAKDYSKVLPELSKKFHVFAVDCNGHGSSCHYAGHYSITPMGDNMIEFIKKIVGEPVYISGHSSGGLLAAWVAANRPDLIKGLVLEDPPFYATDADRVQNTFAWHDTFKPIHEYLQLENQPDYNIWYMEHSLWFSFFGESQQKIIDYAKNYRAKHPDESLKIFFLPNSMTRSFREDVNYDPRFGDKFYDASWLEGIQWDTTLTKITSPTIFIKASTKYGEDGMLWAALSDEDFLRVVKHIPSCDTIRVESGHDVHYEHPDVFVDACMSFLQ